MYVRLCDLQIPTVIDNDRIDKVILLYIYIIKIKKENHYIFIFILVQGRMKM